MGLGEVGIVLPDETSVIDLYSEGFSSLLTEREPADIISFSPLYDRQTEYMYIKPIVPKYNKGQSLLIGLPDVYSNFLFFRITPDDAVMIQPQFTNNFASPFVSIIENLDAAAMKVNYSHSFENGFSAGAKAAYSADYRTNKGWTYTLFDTANIPGPVYMMLSGSVTIKYFDYSVDVSYKLNEEMTVALSGGSDVPSGFTKNFPSNLSGMNSSTYIMSQSPEYDGYFGSGNYYGGDPNVYYYSANVGYNFSTTGHNLNIGVQYIKKGVVEALFSAGIIPDYHNEFKETTTVPGVYENMEESGRGFNAQLKCRLNINDGLTAGIMAEGKGVDYSYNYDDSGFVNKGMDTEYNSDAAAGLTYQMGNFTIPAEFFGHTQNGPGNKYAGIRGGVEYKALDWLSLRLGGEWPGIYESFNDSGENYNYTFTGGAGVIFGSFHADFAILYSNSGYWSGDIAFPSSIQTTDTSVTKISLDLTYKFN
jgi:hypothetical protein